MDETKNEMEAAPSVPKKSGGVGKKIIIIGLPLFIIQLVAVYFITVNILLTRIQANAANPPAAGQVKEEEGAKKEAEEKVELGKFIFTIEDILLNPAGTDGRKIFMLSIAFDLASEVDKKSCEEKKDILKDAVNSIAGSKTLVQLNNIAFRDTLRSEIVKEINKTIKDLKINRVYFSKYIIQ